MRLLPIIPNGSWWTWERRRRLARSAYTPRNDTGNAGYGFPVDFTIQVSTDGTTWNEVVSRTAYPMPGGTVQSFSFASAQARYVKVTGTSLRQNPSDSNYYRMQLAELEVY
ncbi:discoidin domain-containing protein [Cohnella ginsengisoli]|uniref:discoidin domain-containing protein n=1 Tax=Cohnella ginsengisoli TaxID=425004 RepID=UPI003B8A5DDC